MIYILCRSIFLYRALAWLRMCECVQVFYAAQQWNPIIKTCQKRKLRTPQHSAPLGRMEQCKTRENGRVIRQAGRLPIAGGTRRTVNTHRRWCLDKQAHHAPHRYRNFVSADACDTQVDHVSHKNLISFVPQNVVFVSQQNDLKNFPNLKLLT